MAIDPTTTTTVKVGELASAVFSGTDLVPHEVGGILKKGTLSDLATFIGSSISVTSGVGFRAVTVTDGQTLPATTQQEFILVGPGTYPNVGGGATITTTEELNALVSNGTFWFIGVEIPIEANVSGVFEPAIATGTTSQYWRGDKTWQTLNKAAVGLANVDNTSDANKPISTATQTALDTTVKITGNQTIDGVKTFSGISLVLDPSGSTSIMTFKGSGSVVADFSFNSSFTQFLSYATNGYLFKNSTNNNVLSILNSGEATFLGNVTAPAFIKSGGTSSQFLKANGTVDSTSYQPLLTNPITGTGTTNYLSKFTGSGTLGNSLIFDNGSNVGIGTISPLSTLHIKSSNANQLLLDNNGEQFTSQYFANNGTTKGIVLWDNTSALFKVGTFSANDLTLVTNFTERVRVTSGGNVGIGTTAPLTALTVSGNLSLFTTNQLRYYNSAKNNWTQVDSPLLSGDTEVDFRVLTKTGTFYINASGNVGINTTSPTSKLHVVGLPAYADNTTALAGGLTVGAFYHTAGVLKVVI